MSMNKCNEVQFSTHAEIDAKTAPIGLKVLFGITLVMILFGVLAILYLASQDFADTMTILTMGGILLGSAFVLISILGIWIMKLANNKDSIGYVVCKIFIAVGILIYIITICMNIGDPLTLLKIGLPILIMSIFASIGIGLLITGNKMRKKVQGNCTYKIEATCVGFVQPEPAPPIWEFTYQSLLYRLAQTDIISQEYVFQGKKTIIFINPQNPGEIYCPLNNSYNLFKMMGIVFLFISALGMGAMLLVIVSNNL